MARRRRLVAVARAQGLLWVTILWLAVGVGGWLAPSSVEAASVKSVQTGTATMSTATVTVGSAQGFSGVTDTAKAFIVCSNRTNSSNASNQATCEITNTTTLTITVGVLNASEVVRWYVVEFDGGVSVVRGVQAFGTADLTFTITTGLSGINISKSFVLISQRTTSATTAVDEEWTTTAALTATPSLVLTRNESGIATNVAWQVVQMEGATVQRGTLCINDTTTCPGSTGGNTNTATLSPSVDITKSFLILSRRGGTATAGIDAKYFVRGDFSSITSGFASGLTFIRGSTSTTASNQVNISWEVVSLSDGSTVQRFLTSTAATTDATLNQTISAITTSVTVPFIWVSGQAGSTSTTSLDDDSWTATFSTTTNLQLQRVSTGQNASIQSFVVSFNKCALTDATNVAANAQSGQATVYWDSAIALIARNTVDFTAGDVLVNGQTYAVSNTFGTSSPLPTVQSNSSSAASSFNQTGLTNGTTYYYRVFQKTDSPGPCYGPGATSTKTNITPADGSVTGNPNWSYATGQTTLAPPGLTPNGVVVSGSNASKLYGMSASTGTQSFTPFATGNAIQARPPVIPATLSKLGLDVAYITSQDGFVYAIRTDTGAQVWKSASLGTTLQGGAAVRLQAVGTGLNLGCTTNPDLVVVGTKNGDATSNKVYGLHGGGGDCSNLLKSPGAALWTFAPGNMDIISSTPFIDYTNNTIWVTSRSNATTQASLWKLNATTGALIAKVPSVAPWVDIDGSPSNSLDGSFLYVPNNAGALKAINVSTNAVVATHTPASGTGAIQGSPLPFSFSTPSVGTPDTIVFSRTATVHSVSFNGTSFGTNWTTTNFPSAPVTSVSAPVDNFAGTKVYVGASGGKAHQLRLSDGVDEAQANFVGPSTPTGGDPSFDITLGRVYVGATDGHIYSFTSPF